MTVKGKSAPELPQPVQEPTVRVPILPVVAKRLVELAVVEKKLVVVAEVPVASPKERELADTKEPENVELEMEALVKVPPSVMLERLIELRSASLLL